MCKCSANDERDAGLADFQPQAGGVLLHRHFHSGGDDGIDRLAVQRHRPTREQLTARCEPRERVLPLHGRIACRRERRVNRAARGRTAQRARADAARRVVEVVSAVREVHRHRVALRRRVRERHRALEPGYPRRQHPDIGGLHLGAGVAAVRDVQRHAVDCAALEGVVELG